MCRLDLLSNTYMCYQNYIWDASVNHTIIFNVHVKYFLKDVNPFYTLLVGAWDLRKINHLNLNLKFKKTKYMHLYENVTDRFRICFELFGIRIFLKDSFDLDVTNVGHAVSELGSKLIPYS